MKKFKKMSKKISFGAFALFACFSIVTLVSAAETVGEAISMYYSTAKVEIATQGNLGSTFYTLIKSDEATGNPVMQIQAGRHAGILGWIDTGKLNVTFTSGNQAWHQAWNANGNARTRIRVDNTTQNSYFLGNAQLSGSSFLA